ncbi:MAG TPA: gliding motility-associated C-terminal domain-containing protein [Bacteroidia bacterium]|jgi:gliding motility-associated-like protein|nr:gliding motility-associated C-terminal domain-containing protein [Bacteroidia bacterium]
MIRKNLVCLIVLFISLNSISQNATGQCNEMLGLFKSVSIPSLQVVIDSNNSTYLKMLPNGEMSNFDCSKRSFTFSSNGLKSVYEEGAGKYSCDFNTLYLRYTVYINDFPSGPYYDTLYRAVSLSIASSSACSGCNGIALAAMSGFSEGSLANYSYEWNTGQTSFFINGLCPGTYTFTITNPCSGYSKTGSTTIISKTAPPVAITLEKISDVSCYGEDNGSALVAAYNGTPPYNYQWLPGNKSDSLAVSLAAGNYTVMAVDANGCSNFDSVKIRQPSALNLNIASYIPVVYGQSVDLTSSDVNGGTQPYVYLLNGDTTGSNCTITPSYSTTYTVTVADKNGCTVTKPLVIFVNMDTVNKSEIFIPTAFSPNNIGQNDILYVRGTAIKEMSFNIYDRWGNLVYTNTNINDGWDGTYKNHPMNTGEYAYYLKATLNDGTIVSRKGSVLLIR